MVQICYLPAAFLPQELCIDRESCRAGLMDVALSIIQAILQGAGALLMRAEQAS